MGEKEKNNISFATKEYTQILLHQYSECWQSIRNDSNAVWQIPTLLLTTISVLGIAYAQETLNQCQTARILILLLGFGFTLVSLIALIKHRFFCEKRTDDFNEVQRQLKWLLGNNCEFKTFFGKINEGIPKDKEEEKIQFKEIKFKSKELAKDRCCIYRTSAYHWQRNLTISMLIGIGLLLAREFVLLVNA